MKTHLLYDMTDMPFEYNGNRARGSLLICSCVPVLVTRLWEDGWKERYYQRKFSVSSSDVDFVWQVMESYTRGLCWVMAYYYQVMPAIRCVLSLSVMHTCTQQCILLMIIM